MIPPEAKKVFQGESFAVWQWPQKMYDGSVRTFETATRHDSASVICVTERGTILYETQTQPHKEKPFDSLPCGGIEEGEDAFVGAKRELLEETGYASDDWELMKNTRPSTRMDWNIFAYVCRGAKKVAEQKLEVGERIEVLEISFEELLDRADREDFPHLDIRTDLVRAKYDPVSRESFRKKLGL
jgi:8-oxo-dGTP pyrophosphatase MutT (NUDIX family)